MEHISSLPKFNFPDVNCKNEPMKQYLKGSQERKDLEVVLEKYSNQCTEIPLVIGNDEIQSKDVRYQVMPFDHSKKIAKYYWASSALIQRAIKEAMDAREKWEAVPMPEKISILLKAADLIGGKYRMDMNAATMLGQGKTIFQAEIDAAAELVDFLRFNAYFARDMMKYNPISDDKKIILNSLRYRGLEGFIAAISPFNFSAIGGNLATAPALMGNVVLWKPSDTSILSSYVAFKAFIEAGFPRGVINFIPCDGPVFGDTIVRSPHLAGINFTGSVATFRHLWKQVGENLETYKTFPRMVGECGGKNYHFVHPSADIDTVVNCTIRGAFEYSGQKCSACSRFYVPESLWDSYSSEFKIRKELVQIHKEIKVGSPTDYESFLSSVIDEKSFNRIKGYIDYAKSNETDLTIIAGGNCDKTKGYFVEPTIIQTTNPNDKLMKEEIFGPVLTVYVYRDSEMEEALDLVGTTTPYALTGAVFARDKEFLKIAAERLKMTAGNFYMNDKSTGAVVGQQPFGGGRLSGTNDKAGGPHYLLRWTTPQTVKESFVLQKEWKYPYMQN
uniref:Multifunctional fusion protein n=1 Tax=Strigamia maritima TaxID=126957 RepID=T1JMW7_STRMM